MVSLAGFASLDTQMIGVIAYSTIQIHNDGQGS